MSDLAARRQSFWTYAVFTVPLILGIGFLMGQLSNSGYGNDWFDALRKPAAMPPGWAFGAAWSTLYILLGVSIALVLKERRAPGWTAAVGLFAAQMLLNFSWSPIFFGARQAEAGLVVILAILLLSIATAFMFARISKPAAHLMLPYLAWLSFASYLNWKIVQLNPGV